MKSRLQIEQKLLGNAVSKEHENFEKYRKFASCLVGINNSIAVISDYVNRRSCICYGGLADYIRKGLNGTQKDINSIWEDDVFGCLCKEDVERKHIEELCFLHFLEHKPVDSRKDYYMESVIRMHTKQGLINVYHRIYYPEHDNKGNILLSICLYGITSESYTQCVAVNTKTGQRENLEHNSCAELLTRREKEILSLINIGMSSKEISGKLSVSFNTVSRHRQNILSKLHVGSSIEACSLARRLQLL